MRKFVSADPGPGVLYMIHKEMHRAEGGQSLFRKKEAKEGLSP